MKKLFYVVLPVLFFFIFFVYSSAATVNAYGSITNSTSYVQTLVGYYLNSEEYKWTNDFIVIRTGQYQYDLFYGDDLSGNVNYYRLSSYGQYNSEWVFSSGSLSNFSYNLGNYTAVGNVEGSIRSSEYGSQRWYFMGEIFLIVIIIALFIRLFRFGGHKVELH